LEENRKSFFCRKNVETKIGETEKVENNRNECSDDDGTLSISRKVRNNENANYRVLENGILGTEYGNEINLKNKSDCFSNSDNDFYEKFTESDEIEIDRQEMNIKKSKMTTEQDKNEKRNIKTKKYKKRNMENDWGNVLSACIPEGSSIFSTEGHLFLIEPSLRIKKKFDPEKKIGKYPICSYD
jgi:hypothetical protein